LLLSSRRSLSNSRSSIAWRDGFVKERFLPFTPLARSRNDIFANMRADSREEETKTRNAKRERRRILGCFNQISLSLSLSLIYRARENSNRATRNAASDKKVKVPRNHRECSSSTLSKHLSNRERRGRASFFSRVPFLRATYRSTSSQLFVPSSLLSFANSSAANLEHAASEMLREIIRSPLRFRVFFSLSRSGCCCRHFARNRFVVDRVAESHRAKALGLLLFPPNYSKCSGLLRTETRLAVSVPVAINHEDVDSDCKRFNGKTKRMRGIVDSLVRARVVGRPKINEFVSRSTGF